MHKRDFYRGFSPLARRHAPFFMFPSFLFFISLSSFLALSLSLFLGWATRATGERERKSERAACASCPGWRSSSPNCLHREKTALKNLGNDLGVNDAFYFHDVVKEREKSRRLMSVTEMKASNPAWQRENQELDFTRFKPGFFFSPFLG